MSIEKNNTLIHLRGRLGFGVSQDVAKILKNNPNVKGIILDSTGGRIYEGRELSKLILIYGLDTYSLEGCYSASTIAFVAGKNRILGTGANLAFHQYKMGYKNLNPFVDAKKEQEKDLRLFERQGIKQEFLKRLYDATPNDLWYPTIDEMMSAGVIHGIVIPSDIIARDLAEVEQQNNRTSPSNLADNSEELTTPKASAIAPVVVAVTVQSAEGCTDADLDQAGLKNFETWIVNTWIEKGKSKYAELGYDPNSFNPKVEATSVYVTVNGKKLAVIKVNMDNSVRSVTIMGIKGTELHRVTCIRNSNHDIPVWSGECGNKIQEVFGVAIQP